jgi:hypothetical protein
LVLTPGNADDWDGMHVCDPHVVRSELPFKLQARSFQFAMFYTGTRDPTGRGLGNSVGVAVSQALEGPWIKKPNGPLIVGKDGWGAGQPSATSINGSRVMLFFTRGDSNGTRLVRRVVDLSDVERPLLGEEAALPLTGLVRSDGTKEHLLRDAQVSYDGILNRFYAIRVSEPFPSSIPAFIASSVQLAWLPGWAVWSPAAQGASWTVLDPKVLAAPGDVRTFDPGLCTDEYGGLRSSGLLQQNASDGLRLDAIVSIASSEGWPSALWSYRLRRVSVTGH